MAEDKEKNTSKENSEVNNPIVEIAGKTDGAINETKDSTIEKKYVLEKSSASDSSSVEQNDTVVEMHDSKELNRGQRKENQGQPSFTLPFVERKEKIKFNPEYKIVFIKHWLSQRKNKYSEFKGIPRLRHTIINLPPKDLEIKGKCVLFGDFCTVGFSLRIVYQLKLEYVTAAFVNILKTKDQINAEFEAKYEALIKAIAIDNFAILEDKIEFIEELQKIKISIKKEIEEFLKEKGAICSVTLESITTSFKEVRINEKEGEISDNFKYKEIYEKFKDSERSFIKWNIISTGESELMLLELRKKNEIEKANKEAEFINNFNAARKSKFEKEKELNKQNILEFKESKEHEKAKEKILTDFKIFQKEEELRLEKEIISKQIELNKDELSLNVESARVVISDNEINKLKAEGERVIQEIYLLVEQKKQEVENSIALEKLDKILAKLPELVKDERKIEQLRLFQVQSRNHGDFGNDDNFLNPTYKFTQAIHLLKNLFNFLDET